MWPEWSIRFALPASLHQRWRHAAASAVLLVGSNMTAPSALKRLHNETDPGLLTRFLNHAVTQPNWISLSTALIRLADFLNTHQVPIDYDRRRALDYSGLLPDTEWNRICVVTGALPGNGIKAEVARCYLFRRISGLTTHPSLEVPRGIRNRVLNFPLALTTQLDAALQQTASAFLESNHINEPSTWQPPLDILRGLNLSSPESERTDVTALTSAASAANTTVSQIAKRLNISVDTTRYLLERNPLPPADDRGPGTRRDLIRTNRRSALTADMLNKLYCDDGWSIEAIAKRFDTSHGTIARLARSQQIQLRPNETYVDPNWLYDNYVIKRRTLQDITAELDISMPTISNWIHRHRICLKPPETPAHPMTADQAYHFLAPTLSRPSGRRHLQNFVHALEFPSITHASRGLRINRITLSYQIRCLKRDLKGPLLFRWTPHLPMTPTPLGQQVLQAIQTLELNTA